MRGDEPACGGVPRCTARHSGGRQIAVDGDIDALNGRYGRSTIALASVGLAGDKRRWVMKQEFKTPDYPTRWADLPTAWA